MGTVLITGAGGSLGSVLTKLYTDRGDTVRAYDINEAGLADLQKYERARAIYGDITDKDKLEFALRGVDTVVHAAALKNIQITESNPEQVIRVNIQGTVNVAMAAVEQGVKKVIFISSDKAVDSVLIYGDTKAIGEKIWKWTNQHSKNTALSIIRPGNFWESRGNVFEIWEKQKKEGEMITLTDPMMERYFIDIYKAAEFVLMVEQVMKGGEIFIPKMKIYKMLELAEKCAGGKGVKLIGSRNGEKLLEKLWSQEEAVKVKNEEGYIIIK